MTPPRVLLGLGSGTSADAVDLALIQIHGYGGNREVKSLAGGMLPLAKELQVAVQNVADWDLADVAHWHHAFGLAFGEASAEFLATHGWQGQELFAVGSHGQTVFHHDGNHRLGTLQLGHPALIAEAVGCQVVGDFRWADIALGGQGAPISPFADWVLHRHAGQQRGILNLGGIANLTWLRGDEVPMAWDCGPANAPMDALVRKKTDHHFDVDGALAMAGKVQPALLKEWQQDEFFSRSLPRSTGLEHFGNRFVDAMVNSHSGMSLENQLASLAELAAWGVASSLQTAGWQGGTIYVCGGGAHNPALRQALERQLAEILGPETSLAPFAELGWDADLREAVAFALLADAFCQAEPVTGPSISGAVRGGILGALHLPSP